MPGYHMPDGQIEVLKIWNNQWHVILVSKDMPLIPRETKLHTVSYSWFVNLEGNPQAMDYLHGVLEFF